MSIGDASPNGSAVGIPRPPDSASFPAASSTAGAPDAPRRRWSRMRFVLPMIIIVAFTAYLLGRRNDNTSSLDSLKVGDCIATPDATGMTSVKVIACSQPHTQEVYAIGTTTKQVSTGPSADSDTELFRICRTDVDPRIIGALNNSREADAGFLINRSRTGRVVCTAITPVRTGSIVQEFLAAGGAGAAPAVSSAA